MSDYELCLEMKAKALFYTPSQLAHQVGHLVLFPYLVIVKLCHQDLKDLYTSFLLWLFFSLSSFRNIMSMMTSQTFLTWNPHCLVAEHSLISFVVSIFPYVRSDNFMLVLLSFNPICIRSPEHPKYIQNTAGSCLSSTLWAFSEVHPSEMNWGRLMVASIDRWLVSLQNRPHSSKR